MIDYDPHTWSRHLFAYRGSVLRQIGYRVAACTLWAVGVVAAYKYAGKALAIPSTVHSLVGVALGLLLVFRTNASYDRFWEGRRMWGGIVNETRNLARFSRVLLGGASPIHARVVHWTVAFCHASMNGLRGKRGLGRASSLLPAAEVDQVMGAQHAALAVAVKISEALFEARSSQLIGDQQHVALDNNVQLLIDYLGACERIHKTPLPFAYVVHLRRALVAYCLTLPFALVEPFGWGAVAGAVAVAYTFFGIEEIGVQIEDPFGTDENDLPLERICETIERNLLALVQGDAPQPIGDADFSAVSPASTGAP